MYKFPDASIAIAVRELKLAPDKVVLVLEVPEQAPPATVYTL